MPTNKNNSNPLSEQWPREKFLPLFKGLRQVREHKWWALCVVHEDHTPSLRINEKDNGELLMHCFACKANGAAVAPAVGLEIRDLFPEGLWRADPKPPAGPSYAELLRIIRFEATVVSIIAIHLQDGAPAEETVERLNQAAQRISNALAEGGVK